MEEISYIKRKFWRRVFDILIDGIMKEYGYSSVDEGEHEAVIEKLHGIVLLHRNSDFDIWIYNVKPDRILIRDWSGSRVIMVLEKPEEV